MRESLRLSAVSVAFVTGAITFLAWSVWGLLMFVFLPGSLSLTSLLLSIFSGLVICLCSLVAVKRVFVGGGALVALSIVLLILHTTSRVGLSFVSSLISSVWMELPVFVAGILLLVSGLRAVGKPAPGRLDTESRSPDWSCAAWAVAILAGAWASIYSLFYSLEVISDSTARSTLLAIDWGTALIVIVAIASARKFQRASGISLIAVCWGSLLVSLGDQIGPGWHIHMMRGGVVAAAYIGISICLPMLVAGVMLVVTSRSRAKHGTPPVGATIQP